MKNITISINTVNGAFNPENNEELIEVTRILKEFVDKLEMGYLPEKLYDINGNSVGSVLIK